MRSAGWMALPFTKLQPFFIQRPDDDPSEPLLAILIDALYQPACFVHRDRRYDPIIIARASNSCVCLHILWQKRSWSHLGVGLAIISQQKFQFNSHSLAQHILTSASLPAPHGSRARWSLSFVVLSLLLSLSGNKSDSSLVAPLVATDRVGQKTTEGHQMNK